MWELGAFAALGYLLGSVPAAYWLTWWLRREDIRHLGDRNPGMANVFRSVGPVAGLLVGTFDLVKGGLVVALAQQVGVSGLGLVAVGAATVLGHIWPIFLGFDGGAGAATALGVALVIFPLEMAVAAVAAAPAFVGGHRLAQHREVPAALVITTVFLVMAFITQRPPEMILGLGAVGLLVGLRVFLWRPRRYGGSLS